MSPEGSKRGAWSYDEYRSLLDRHSPFGPKPTADELAALASEIRRAPGAIAWMWTDANRIARGRSSTASHRLRAYVTNRGWQKPTGTTRAASERADWSEGEVRAAIDGYFGILNEEIENRAVNKAEHVRDVTSRLNGRTKGSVERKYQNISALLQERHLSFVNGYKPLGNYQALLRDLVDAYLAAQPDLEAQLRPAEPPIGPVTGSKAVEDAAVRWIMKLERAAGRVPRDRRYERGFVADLESPPRIIELKASSTSYRGWFLPLQPAQLQAAISDPRFHIYVVENIGQGDPAEYRLKVLHGERLRALAKRSTTRTYVEMPWPVADYDTGPGLEQLRES